MKNGNSAGFGAYSASKMTVEILANTAAQELGSKGITVNTIHPGKSSSEQTDSYYSYSLLLLQLIHMNDISMMVSLVVLFVCLIHQVQQQLIC
jgi:NAD(P)-dependent dehydrogenase (short-subunit alcohol dehydrogenase family)